MNVRRLNLPNFKRFIDLVREIAKYQYTQCIYLFTVETDTYKVRFNYNLVRKHIWFCVDKPSGKHEFGFYTPSSDTPTYVIINGVALIEEIGTHGVSIYSSHDKIRHTDRKYFDALLGLFDPEDTGLTKKAK